MNTLLTMNTAAPCQELEGEPVSAMGTPSYGQRSLWFLQHLAPQGSAYNIAAAARVRTPIDARALEHAFQALVDRHAALRTTFPSIDGAPCRRVAGRQSFSLVCMDASGWSEQELRARLAEEAWRPFDLERGPLLRAALLMGGPGGPVLLLAIHHIVADFWSLAILVRELPLLYREAAGAGPAQLSSPGMDYEEHVRMEGEALGDGRGEALLAYWQETLAGLPALELPLDRPRPAVQTDRGDSCRLRLPGELAAALRARSRKQHATLFMTLAAAFQVLLCRHSGQEDLAIGAPRAGRSRSELAGTVGYFVNPVVLRGDLTGDPTFAELLERTRATVLAAFEHGDYPLPLLVEHLQPVRDASRTPLFQVSFVMQKETRGVEGLTAFALGEEGVLVGPEDFRLETLSLPRPPAPFELMLHAVERQGGLSLALQFNTDLFDTATALHLLDRFARLLRSVVESPELALSALPLLSAAERHQLLHAWNDTRNDAWNDRAEAGPEATLYDLFAAQAERTPEAEAVVFDEERLTYRELAARAQALAHHLVRLGVGPEVVVGVAAERSVGLIAGLLGVLGAGGAYLPLEPDLPRQRLAMILEDAAPAVVLTRRAYANTLPLDAVPGLRLAWLDEVSGLPAGAAQRLPRAAADNAAYVIYTSGSTGRPKGVVNSHRGIVNRLLWMQEACGLDAGDRFLQKTPFGFDVSVPEFFAPLILGARLVVARPDGHRDSAYLARLVEQEGVTTIHFVPSMLPFFLAEDGVAARCRSLRRVLVSGEALPWEVEQRCLATLPVPLYNLYGPTEAAVEVTAWSCRPAERPRPGENPRPVPIGRPIRNTQIHVVGRRLEPVPPGAVGELAIGGVQVARGYRGRPDLTAERFVPNPFGPPGSRLYRTGDLCRHRPGGEIEYLGRLDDQVKIRGFRIEPREIEIVLGTHPEVREAAVVVRQDGAGERSLLACVVPAAADAGAGTAAELRAALAARLPPSMVPAFAFGRALDRLPNGKLDRRALARWIPMALPGRPLEAPEAPRTPLEELLAGLFAEVLGVDRLGVEESFFEHGGHSLAAMRLTARIREALGTELPLHRVFEAPTVAALARAVAGEARSAAPPLVPVSRATPRATPLPLSFAQQRLWFLHQLEPASPVYNMPAALYLPGRLDRAMLAAALGEVARRHESLRTRCIAIDGEPVQVVDPPAPVPVPEIDLAGLPAARRLEEARRLAREEALHPFDLARGPLLRTSLVRLGEAEQLLLLTMHHVISDGWSLRVLARELSALYDAGLERRPSPLPELAIQYGDYAVWQRGWLRGEVLEAELAHWRARLAGAPPVLDLPLDRPRPAVMSSRGASRALALSPALLPSLQALARRQGVTLFMAVLAAFQALLARISNTDDVSVGSPVAGRGQLRTEGLIGFFVNTLVLRTDLSGAPGAPSFAELLARVRETSLAAYAHQDLPFEKLVEELHPQRDLSYAPLVQVSFVLDSDPPPALRLGDVEAALWPLETEIEKLDLSLTLGVGPAGLSGAIGFRSDLFDGATIERLAGHFGRLLAGAVAAPQQRLPELPLLSAEEREQLLRMGDGEGDGEGEGESYPREATLHDLFAEQAALRPDAVALAGLAGLSGQGTGTALTYGELARQATRWARRLRVLGVGPEVRVALCLDRAPAQVVATLAVLAAGGAYVPLDPAYPRERLAFLMRSSAAPVLITEERWLPMLSEMLSELLSELPDRKVAILCLDGAVSEGGERGEREAALPAVDATGLAYVMYTSGSTGEPKGVAVTHRGVVRLVRGTGYARFGPGETLFLYAPYTFDASTLELWGALLHGSRLVIPPPGVLTPAELGEVVEREGVTTLLLTAGLFRQMVEENLEALSGVRQLLTGGDVVPVAHSLRVLAELPETRLINAYGPTENTTFTSCYTVRAAAELDPSVPVGRPIAHTWIAVLDRYQMPVPPGVAGELCTGGDGLARGYLDLPDRTAKRFLPDPEGREAGGRLYRTGDLVRWRRSGDLEFLGRIDAQVKVRGFRVEPGEIETALTAHPRLSSAVVLAQREEAGGHRLVAYVVAAADATVAPEPSELRDFLRQRLPEFMVPSAWVSLPVLPLTANSKVDRKALALLQPDRPRSTGGALRTPAEERIAAMFAELLGAEQVGPEADFFDLGGHSLLATRLVSRVRGVFGVELPLQAVFETPTVAGLATQVDLATGAERSAAPLLDPVVRVSREEPLALSFAQQRLWFLERIETGAAYLHLPAALDCAGRLDPAALAGSLAGILHRHEGLRTRFVLSGRHPLQIPLSPAELAAVPLVPCIDLSALPETAQEGEVSRWTAAEAARPFDLARGPLLHAVLLRRGPESHRLLLTVHHIAADAWSLGLLIRELGELYAARVEAGPSHLPELSVHYADYAVWQRRRLQGDRLEELLRYWRERLTPRPPALELPTDRPRPPVRNPRGARRPVRFDAAAVDAMRRLGGPAGAAPTGATLFMVFLAVFQAVLARHAGQDDVAVGTAVADRPDPALEGVIGLFLNILVLRGDLSGDPTFRTLLMRVRETALGAFAHAELPFEQLVDALQPERDLSRSPLFQVLFTLRSEPLPELALPGLALRQADTFTGAVQFDLSLLLEESRSGGIDGWIEHSSDLFDGTTVERLALHCSHLLASAAADPARRLSDLPLLSEAEGAQLRVEWNDTRTALPLIAPIGELFRAQVERTPLAVAAVDAEAELTYRELADRASRLARWLVRSGVRPGDRVGVCVERSLPMLVSLLAVLEAGAAYVPLDPAYPQARLAAMLEDSQATALIASAPSGTAGASLLHPRTFSPEAPGESSAPLPLVPAASPAYILYTSGSTGAPKGVVVSHANACNLFVAMDAELRPQTPGVWLAVTSICFDISVVELLWTLTRGFRVVIHDERPAGEGVSVAEQIARHGVSHLQCTPSMAGMLAAIPERLRSLAPLSHLLLGGEALPAPLADRLAATVAGAVRNLYGPTEATVYSLGQRVEGGEARPPIGRPLSNTEAYLLDASLRPVPLGARGEVFLGGDGVAMGYWRRPDLTAERFLPDPLGSRPGGRLYRTGDLARHRKDGSVDYLGRSDHQVKVRGVRMELGEIEEALRAHPAVAQTVAAVRDDGPGGRQLIGYLVPVAGGPAGGPSASELRRFLAERLPEAMIPAAFVPLAALPLTENGKVDRKALPAPDTGRLRLDSAYAPPRTPAEKTLAAIWQDVLGHDRIGVNDNFFELGGSSLLLVEIEARLREAFHREIPIVEMFRHPTIRSLAEVLEARGRQPAPAVAAEARPAPARGPAPVAAGEGGTLDRQRQAVEELRRRRASQQRSSRR